MQDRAPAPASTALALALKQHEQPLAALRAAMNSDPLQHIRDAMRHMSVPDYGAEMRKAMAALSEFKDPLREAREAMRAFETSTALKQLEEAMSAVRLSAGHTRLLDEMRAAAAFADPLKSLRSTLAEVRFIDPAREMRQALNSWKAHDATAAFQHALRDLNLQGLREALSPQSWPEAHELPADDDAIVSGPQDALVVGSASLARSDVQGLLDQAVDTALAKSAGHLESVIAALVKEIRSLRNPLHERILTWLVFPILVATIFALINPLADYYIKEALATNERKAKKEIKAQVQGVAAPTQSLDEFRFVSRSSLAVRLNARAKSPVVGTLTLGQVVLLVERRDAWSLVAWQSEDGTVILRGWVYARYLSKFR